MKSNQSEQLFTELTPTEASSIEGGKGFSDTLLFDASQSTKVFSGVRSGGIVQLSSNTFNIGGRNTNFNAILKNLTTGKKYRRVVKVGQTTATWTNMRGGKDRYTIQFTDSKDGIYVAGPIGVYYS